MMTIETRKKYKLNKYKIHILMSDSATKNYDFVNNNMLISEWI